MWSSGTGQAVLIADTPRRYRRRGRSTRREFRPSRTAPRLGFREPAQPRWRTR